jgi:hypothetical protein
MIMLSDRYTNDLKEWARKYREWVRQWPHYCDFCGGTGCIERHEFMGMYGAERAYDNTPAVCPKCVEEGLCPRCGHEITQDDNNEDICPACQWKGTDNEGEPCMPTLFEGRYDGLTLSEFHYEWERAHPGETRTKSAIARWVRRGDVRGEKHGIEWAVYPEEIHFWPNAKGRGGKEMEKLRASVLIKWMEAAGEVVSDSMKSAIAQHYNYAWEKARRVIGREKVNALKHATLDEIMSA